MKLLTNLQKDLTFKITSDSVVAIGNFDGVHLGHQEIIKTLKLLGNSYNYSTILMTFSPHPVLVVRPQKNLKLIIGDYYDRVKMAKFFDIDYAVLEKFSDKFRTLTPDDFILFLKDKLKMKHLVVGDDYNFGKNRSGDVNYLTSITSKYDFNLTVVPEVAIDGKRITSSYIRTLLQKGLLESTNKYLLSYFYLKGFVEAGFRRGHIMGYPTANLKLYTYDQMIPSEGVYITLTKIGNEVFQSMTNIGDNPTFRNEDTTIETHILDFDKMIYYQKIKLYFLKKIRGVIKFNNIDELMAQLRDDKKTVTEYFKRVTINTDKLL